MSYCLPKEFTDKFVEALRGGKIVPEKLITMSSAERRAFLEGVVGKENAAPTNALLESKLLLKDQKRGMVTWAKQVSGISEPVRRDLISRIEKMEKVLDPVDARAFLEDLAAKKLGTEVTFEEAKKITEIAKKGEEAKAKVPENSPIASPERMQYGRALVELQNYVTKLMVETKKTTLADVKAQPVRSLFRGISNLGGLAKSVKASLDLSAIGRQGRKVMATNPTIWLRNSLKSLSDVVKTFGGKEVLDEVRAEVLSRPNALRGLYDKEKLAVGVVEEAYPTSLPERIPLLGKPFKASQEAFTAFQYRTRADVFDRYVEIAEKSGADIAGIGKVVNSLTGRGTFGQRLEGAATELNNVFFSPRFLKSNIDLLTGHTLDTGIGSFARKQAALNLVKVVASTAVILSIAEAINPDSVEFDPRSSDFGKIKVGATRFDVTGGMASIITLATRLIRQSSKSSTSGKITKIDDPKAYKGATTLSVLGDYFANKTAPFPSYIISLRLGQDRFTKEPINLSSAEGIKNSAKSLFAPLPITNYAELRDNPDSAPILWAMIADALGFGTNTY